MINIKKSVLLLSLLFSSTHIYALSHLSNDFRDVNNSLNITYFLDGFSDKLAFDTFEDEWEVEPNYKEKNNAFGEHYSDIYYSFETIKVGLFKQELAEIDINSGLMQTIFNVQKDFSKLLGTQTINNDLENSPINGNGNYYDTYGFFLQKIFKPLENHFLSVKLKLHYATKLQSINILGETNSEHFKGSIDYYYTQENHVTKGDTQSSSAKGLGYGIDLEYIYKNKSLFLYVGAFNLGSYIYWDNVTYMHYDLDSQTIYKGDDGFNHSRPFGTGYYKYNISFKQKLPQYYKTSIDYELGNDFSIGYNLNIYDNMYHNEPNISYRSDYGIYKLGYLYENNIALFGIYFKHIALQISNRFSTSNNVLKANIKFSY